MSQVSEPIARSASPRLTVHVDESPVGAGKTEAAIKKATTFPSRWLFAVEKLEGIDEVRGRIEAAASLMAHKLKIVAIRSDTALRGYSVRQEVEALPSQYGNASHVIVLCTHAALLMSDLQAFHGWNLIIDEVPGVLRMQEVQTKLDAAFFETNFSLSPVTNEWSRGGLTDEGRGLSGSDFHQDDSHNHLGQFFQRVRDSEAHPDRHVVCNLADWAQMQEANLKWVWWSLFSIHELGAFASVQFLANGFSNSLAAKLLRGWNPEVQWDVCSSNGSRTLVPRRVSVRYFSRTRCASVTLFKSGRGVRALAQIGRHIAYDVPKERFIWSANKVAAPPLVPNLGVQEYLTPRQAGTDSWMHCTHAAMMYAAKPSMNTRAMLKCFGLTADDWTASTEWETILQFVTRTSIRDVSSDEHSVVYVFDKQQADYLMRFFGQQPHIQPDLQFVDLHLDLAKAKPGPKKQELTPKQVEERKERRRVQKKLSEQDRRARLKLGRATKAAERGAP